MQSRVRTRPRKHPQQARSQDTVDAILTATARILVMDGFDRATTNRIAEAAGVSIGSLYQYFPSKEALVAALMDRHVTGTMAIFEGALERLIAAPLGVAARAMVELMIGAHQHDPKLHKVLCEQVPRIGWLDRLSEIDAQVMRLVTAYLEAHQRQLRPRNMKLAAFVAVQTVEALTHAAVLFHPEYLEDEEFIDEMTTLLVGYLALPPSQAAGRSRSRASLRP